MMRARRIKIHPALPRSVLLLLLAVPAFGQGTAIEPCPGRRRPQKVGTRWNRLPVDASIPNDPEVEKIMAPYTEKVRELSKVIGRLEGWPEENRSWCGLTRTVCH